MKRTLAGQATEEEKPRSQQLRDQQIEEMPALRLKMRFDLQVLDATMPEKAQIYRSIICSGCDEKVMETRLIYTTANPTVWLLRSTRTTDVGTAARQMVES